MKFFILSLLSFSVLAQVNILTTTTDIAWMAKKIGGEKVTVESLLDGSEDPHYVDAMPHWIAKVSRAQIFCQVGLDLEVAWVPRVLEKSGNKNIQNGEKGFCDLGRKVSALDKIKGRVDRSMGDVHAGGNPHYHLGPKFFLEAAEEIVDKLIEVDAENATYYLNNYDQLKKEFATLQTKIRSILKSKPNVKLMSYHKEFSYFVKEYGLNYIGEIEETPGVPPSAGRIARVSLLAKKKGATKALGAKTNPKAIMEKFKEISGVPYEMVDISINSRVKSYEDLMLSIAKAIVK